MSDLIKTRKGIFIQDINWFLFREIMVTRKICIRLNVLNVVHPLLGRKNA